MTPKDFFLHLGIVATLYVSTIAFISFLFSLITLLYPVGVQDWYQLQGAQSSIAWSLSVFLVVYPVLVYLLFKTSKYLRKNTERAGVAIRKWFISATIFLTAVTIVIDLIVLLTTFLRGEELTAQFLLKVLAVIVVALIIFWFSIKDLRNQFLTEIQTLKRVMGVMSGILIIVVIVGFFAMGSPQEMRQRKNDATRVEHLSLIQSEIIEYWRMKGQLPENLLVLNDAVRYVEIPTDPITGDAYEYTANDELDFTLCAVFETKSQQLDIAQSGYKGYAFENYFEHEIGTTCFTRTIDPERITPSEPVRVR